MLPPPPAMAAWPFLPDSLASRVPVHQGHHSALVFVAIAIAILTAHAAFAVVERLGSAQAHGARRAHLLWLTIGAWAMGTGIWAMHFVGMLSWNLPLPFAFAAATTLASVVPAILASGVALQVLTTPRHDRVRTAVGAVLVSTGIATMHFMGMSAIRMDADLYYRADLFAASIVAVLVLSTIALSLRAAPGDERPLSGVRRLTRVVLLGSALASMHFVAMASVVVFPHADGLPPSGVIPDATLASLVSAAVAFVVGTTLVGTRVDQLLVQLSRELMGREARYQAVLDAMADALITFDLAGTIESANPSAGRMFGTATPLVGRPFGDLLPEFDRSRMERLDGGEPMELTLGASRETTGRRLGGTEFPVEVTVSRFSHDGRTIFSAIVRDVSERVQGERRRQEYVHELERSRATLEEQAQQLVVARDRAEQGARAKSDFLAMMSHELRTPMNGVLGMAQLLLHTPLSQEQAARVHMLRKSGESLLRIINDVLDFSKIEAGKLSIESHAFDLPALLEEVRETLASAADVVGLSLTVDVDVACPRIVVGDAGRIRQVLFNLVGNAIKFTDRGGVTIRAHLADAAPGSDEAARHVVELSVTDTGIGMSRATLEQLFAPFTQGDASPTRRHGGTGLGLAISRRLAEMMQGHLSVTSTPGSGSCFTLAIPLPPAPPNARPAHAATPAPRPVGHAAAASRAIDQDGHRVHVLLAEDNMVNQVVAVALLAHLGCTVDVAADGREAVRRWSEGSFDLILMDCQMPEMDGMEATRHIREAEATGHHIPIVALTANAMPEDRVACLAAGMDDHISKPVTEEALLAAIALAREGRLAEAGARTR